MTGGEQVVTTPARIDLTGRRHRLVIADDAPEVRLLLRALLESTEGFEVVGEAVDGRQALSLVDRLHPDLLLLDLSMPGVDGFAVLSELRHRAPDVRVVVHSALDQRLVGLGPADFVAAFVPKGAPLEDLVQRLLQVAEAPRVVVPEPRAAEAPVSVDLVARLGAALRFQDELQAVEMDEPTALRLLADRAQALVGADGAAIELAEEGGLVHTAGSGILSGTEGLRITRSDSLSVRALAAGGLLHIDDTAVDDRVDSEACRRLGVRSAVVVPLATTQRPGAVLKVVSRRPQAFAEHDRHVLALVTRAVAARLDVVLTAHALAASERLYRAAIDSSPIGTALVGLDGRWLQVNDALVRIVGYRRSELLELRFQDITHPADLDADVEQAQALLRGDIASYTMEKRYLHAQGHAVWVRLHGSLVRDDEGEPLYFVAQVEDISELRRQQEALQRLAVTDPLTGLPNREALMAATDHALARLPRSGGVIGMLLLDLDHFKLVNDTLGHQAGDALLIAVAGRLSAAARPGDVVARLGGDEFVVLLEDAVDAATADRVARRVVRAFDQPFDVGDEQMTTIGCSIGVAVASAGGRTDELYQQADMALYRAKGGGRGRYAVFDRSLQQASELRLRTEQVLRRALAEGRLTVHYQPIVDLQTGKVVAVEALARLVGEDVPTATFVTVAEDAGLIAELDQAVLGQAVGLAARRPAELPDLAEVHVNVAAASLGSRDWLAVADPHRMTGPVQVALEVTERTLLASGSSAMSTLAELTKVGVRVGLDDFGTGYSSLSLLHRSDVRFVKLDRSFVAQLPHDTRAAAVVAAVVGMSHALGLVVVAEGVETVEQLAAVQAAGCDRGQGHLLGRPVPLPELLAGSGAES